jgi:predicted ArsR family transcriptional regulator
MASSHDEASPEERHRALGNRSRTRLLELLRGDERGRDAHALAAELELHVNTVRSHLAVLERAGLVRSAPEDRRVRGRPRIIYHATGDTLPEPGPDADHYRFLASVLTSGLVTETEQPAALAERAGERWGHHLVERPAPGTRSSRAEVIARVRRLLADLGFEPEADPVDPAVVELRHCPFRSLAVAHPEVVCAVHLGVLRGAVAEAGGSDVTVSLEPFTTSTTCVARVA